MMQIVLIGSLVAVLIVSMIVKLAKTPKGQKPWKPDFRRGL
jgi:hypothetical protein